MTLVNKICFIAKLLFKLSLFFNFCSIIFNLTVINCFTVSEDWFVHVLVLQPLQELIFIADFNCLH